MPTIIVEGPPIETGKKRTLVRTVSEAASSVYGIPVEKMIVLIKENQPENVGLGGELLADRRGAGQS